MRTVKPLFLLTLIVLGSCGRKAETPDFQMRTDTGTEVPPEMKRQFAEMARRQAEGLAGATTIVHRAYNYTGHSQIKPIPGGKLVAVDVEFRGYGEGFDPDDVEILDGASATNYGSDPDIAYLTLNGKFKSYEYSETDPDKPLRYLFVYAVPSETASIRLGYWTKIITTNSVALRADGLALPPRENKTK